MPSSELDNANELLALFFMEQLMFNLLSKDHSIIQHCRYVAHSDKTMFIIEMTHALKFKVRLKLIFLRYRTIIFITKYKSP